MKKWSRVVAEETMRVVFSGVAVDDGTIDARQLGSSLVNLADAVGSAHSAVRFPDMPSPVITIRETGQGSFWIELVVSVEQGALQTVTDGLTGKYVEAALNLSGLVGLVVVALSSVKGRKGRKAKRIEESSAKDVVKVEYIDGTKIEYPAAVWRVMENPNFQKSARGLVRPVTTDGISHMEISATDDAERESVTITKDEFKDFEIPETDGPESITSEAEIYVSPVTVEFSAGKKWRLNDGDRDLQATIIDADFLARVDSGATSINKLDMFKVLLRTDQTIMPNGRPRTEHTVVQVLKHNRAGHAGQQSPLPMPE